MSLSILMRLQNHPLIRHPWKLKICRMRGDLEHQHHLVGVDRIIYVIFFERKTVEPGNIDLLRLIICKLLKTSKKTILTWKTKTSSRTINQNSWGTNKTSAIQGKPVNYRSNDGQTLWSWNTRTVSASDERDFCAARSNNFKTWRL